MASRLERALQRGRTLRVIGFDDAPFPQRRGARVNVSGVVCAGTRFEGMVWGQVRKDGWGATDEVCRLLETSKFLPQLHLVLLDGIAFGGFNLVDLPTLAERLERPCVALMRRRPNLDGVRRGLRHLTRPAQRIALLERAGEIHERPPFIFQVQGTGPDAVEAALGQLTDQGHVPEALRLAHLIGSAIKTGESSKRA